MGLAGDIRDLAGRHRLSCASKGAQYLCPTIAEPNLSRGAEDGPRTIEAVELHRCFDLLNIAAAAIQRGASLGIFGEHQNRVSCPSESGRAADCIEWVISRHLPGVMKNQDGDAVF